MIGTGSTMRLRQGRDCVAVEFGHLSASLQRLIVERCSDVLKCRSLQLLAAFVLTSCAPPASNDAPPILPFNGSGTSPNDVQAVTPAIEHYWEEEPKFTGWGAVVGKYPDETPAIVEGTSGKGWVILCGLHPEAPESWRLGMTFTTPANLAF